MHLNPKILNKTLIFVPTYNEKDNVDELCNQISELNSDLHILFVDDNSPDGTGKKLDELANSIANITVLHRRDKLGIGSAHQAGINWAYQNKYSTLITMDADFTHSPKHILDLISYSEHADVVIGSRYVKRNSMEGWTIHRRLATKMANRMIRIFLGMGYDSTGAFRLYKIDKIPKEIFKLVKSPRYSFFFESLYVLHSNNFCILEYPIVAPARSSGSSKMRFSDVFDSCLRLVKIFRSRLLSPKNYQWINSHK